MKRTIKILSLTYIFVSISFLAKAQLKVGAMASYHLSFNKSSEIKYDDQFDFLTYKVRFIEEDIAPVLGAFISYENKLVYVKGGLALRNINSRFSYIDYLNYDDLSPNGS